MWISKKRLDELEKKCGCLGYLEVKLKECVNRIDHMERIMKYAKDGEITYIDQHRTRNLEKLYYVYLNNREFEISIPPFQKIYDIKRTKKKDVVIVMSRENTTDDNPVYCNFIIDLVSGDKVEIGLDDIKKYRSKD